MFIFIVHLVTNLASRQKVEDFVGLTKLRIDVVAERLKLAKEKNDFLQDRIQAVKEGCVNKDVFGKLWEPKK